MKSVGRGLFAVSVCASLMLGTLVVYGGDSPETWHPPLIFPDSCLTYRELCDAAYRRASSFLALGISQGDHVGILMANCPEYMECLLGAQLIGAMVVPVNALHQHRLTID